MRTLLVALNAKYIHSNPALYSLKAYAKKYSGEDYTENIQIAEYTINHKEENILADIYGKTPDMVAFSCYIWNWNMIQDIIVELHKLMPQVPIWLGGPEVSFDAELILGKYPFLTGIMVGEGEVTFLELMNYYEKNDRELNEIKGIITKDGTYKERELTNLSDLPFLYHDLAPFENRIIYYESSRGCPYRCSYCLSSIDKSLRLRDIAIVKKELQFFLDQNLTQIKFVDRTFNCNHSHAMEIWEFIKEQDNGKTNFHFEIAADIITDEEILLLNSMRPGLVQLEIGVQSANDKTLEEINRTMDIEKLSRVVAAIQKGNNIHVHLDLIAGLPFEDLASFQKSFDRVYKMEPQQLQLGFLKVLKGSYMFDKTEEYGIKYTSKPPYEVLFTNWLSYEDVQTLKQVEEMVELYYNSNQFTHTLPALVSLFESSYSFFEKLADFYRRKGYFVNSPARSYRYDVLLEFAMEVDSCLETLYKELLTFDMYLRENLKSRPVFAADQETYKEEIRMFYQEEEKNPRYLKDYQNYQARQMIKMTHMEVFFYPVWDNLMIQKIMEIRITKEDIKKENIRKEDIRKEDPAEHVAEKTNRLYFLLFDYQKRNPLNYEADYYITEK